MRSTKSADLIDHIKFLPLGTTLWLQRDQTLPLFAKGVALETKLMSMYLRITLLNLLHSSVASSNHWPWEGDVGTKVSPGDRDRLPFKQKELPHRKVGVAHTKQLVVG